jgi:glutamine synthetase
MTDSRTHENELPLWVREIGLEIPNHEALDEDEFKQAAEELTAKDELTPEALYQAARALESDEDQERQFTVEILELLGMSSVEELLEAFQTGYRRPPG